jgi:hypothetical protein
MKLGHLLEAPKPAHDIRVDSLKLQQLIIDNEYGADLDAKMNSMGGMHVTLPNLVDELIWHNAHSFHGQVWSSCYKQPDLRLSA